MENPFEICDCRPAGLWGAKRTSLRRIAPFVRLQELRRTVTPRHWKSDLHGYPNYVA
jgi:hypothetical protein